MKLAIDIGNTSIRSGIFKDKNNIQGFYSCASNSFIEFENFIMNLESLEITKIIISSVVPNLNKSTKKLLHTKFPACPINFINFKISQIKTIVPEPETIGVDRLCNMFAAIKFYSTPAIIIDFGTATTYDVLDKNQIFIGGIIAPGVLTSAKSLINSASLLPEIVFEFPAKVIGETTKENIQSGIMYGSIAQIEAMISKINQETNTAYSIILTGGFSKILSGYLKLNHIQDIDLTLKGMIAIDESNL